MTFNDLKESNPKKTLIKVCTYIGEDKDQWMKEVTDFLKSNEIIGSTDAIIDCSYVTNNDGSKFIREDVIFNLKKNTINTDNVDQMSIYTVECYIDKFKSQFK